MDSPMVASRPILLMVENMYSCEQGRNRVTTVVYYKQLTDCPVISMSDKPGSPPEWKLGNMKAGHAAWAQLAEDRRLGRAWQVAAQTRGFRSSTRWAGSLGVPPTCSACGRWPQLGQPSLGPGPQSNDFLPRLPPRTAAPDAAGALAAGGHHSHLSSKGPLSVCVGQCPRPQEDRKLGLVLGTVVA